jgi:hypothetical protein
VNKSQATKLYMVAPNSFSIIMAVLSLCTKMCVNSHAPSSKHQVRVKFTGPFRNMGQYKGPCFMLSFWYLVCGVVFWICGKFVSPGKDDLNLGVWGSLSFVCGQVYGSDMSVTMKHSFPFVFCSEILVYYISNISALLPFLNVNTKNESEQRKRSNVKYKKLWHPDAL